jgi:hypothetical protein
MTELKQSADPRCILLVRLLKAGFKWAGSSLIVFLGQGVPALLAFVSEAGGDGAPLHDIDVYRDKNRNSTIEDVISDWAWEKTTKYAVDKFTLRQQDIVLALDHVNYSTKTFQPGTDLWANMYISMRPNGDEQYGRFHQLGPPVEVTLENALTAGGAEAVPCYVLRSAIHPAYKEKSPDGVPRVADDADGRFTMKLYKRSQPRGDQQPLVKLIMWQPTVTAIINPGKNRDGYWQCDHVVEQTARALDAFEQNFPGAVAVFGFDRSSNHAAYAEDSLQASKLLVGDKTTAKSPPPPSRPGWYKDANGVVFQQEMNLPSGRRKGHFPFLTHL